MQIILISSNNSVHKHWHFTRKSLVLLAVTLIVVVAMAMITLDTKAILPVTPIGNNTTTLVKAPVVTSVKQTPIRIIPEYYTQRLGQLQAESIRLKALTEKIAKLAGANLTGFELESLPPIGGLASEGNTIPFQTFELELDQLSSNFKVQDDNLELLQELYLTNNSITSAIPQGSPSEKGWISSYYGKRIDPFNGKKVFHSGIDIAGKSGSEVVAVADGIISWTGKRSGYGQLIEIDHGNGYITRYAHNKELIVDVGDRIKKGEPIALMGSTGRSTGPHVHFEVLRDGKAINPYSFIKG